MFVAVLDRASIYFSNEGMEHVIARHLSGKASASQLNCLRLSCSQCFRSRLR